MLINHEASAARVVRVRKAERILVTNATFPLNQDMHGFMEIADGRIAKIGSGIAPEVGPQVQVIDCTGQFVIPGLVDAHVHLNGDETLDPTRRHLVPRDTARTLRAARDAYRVIASGFTTVRAMGHNSPEIVYGLREGIESGICHGPHILTCGWPISQTGGSGNLPAWPYSLVEQLCPRAAFADGALALRVLVRKNFAEGADFAKFFATEGIVTSAPRFRGKVNFTAEEMEAIVDEAHRRGAKVITHANTSEGIRRAVLAGVDSVEHSPGEPNKDLAQLLADRRVFHTATLHTRDRWLRRVERGERAVPQPVVDVMVRERDANIVFLQQGKQAGVRALCGSDSGFEPEYGTSARELELFVEGGFKPREALAAATVTAAEALGVPGQIGVLAPGALADFVIMKQNPTENIYVLQDKSNIVQVFRSEVGLDPLG